MDFIKYLKNCCLLSYVLIAIGIMWIWDDIFHGA